MWWFFLVACRFYCCSEIDFPGSYLPLIHQFSTEPHQIHILFKYISIFFRSGIRSTDTEDYMKIELAPSQSVCQEPPKPPPLPPSLVAFISNGDAVDNPNSSKTNTINSTTSNNANAAMPQSQDTATRKQQQPLSAISIQDLNSVQVCLGFCFCQICHQIFFSRLNVRLSFLILATTHRQNATENIFATDSKHEHAMLIVNKWSLPLAKNWSDSRTKNV